MKIIFVDFDGTLRSDASLRYWRKQDGDITKPHPEALDRLENLVRKTGAKLVITGKDRCLDIKELKALLNRPIHPDLKKSFVITKTDSVLIENLFDTTPILRGSTRGEEIRRFIMHHSSRIRDYVVLDAHEDLYPLEDNRVINVDPATGLLEEHVAEAISRLR